jgi:hypothetical protein
MTRPPLTLALSSVLTAAIDNAGRPGLLATLRPDLDRTAPNPGPGHLKPVTADPPLAQVITLPRVIPMPRRGPAGYPNPAQDSEPPAPSTDPDPFSAA